MVEHRLQERRGARRVRVGVGQSMYEMAEYTSANSLGTAVLLEALAERPVRKLVVASSMSIYGEGLYRGGDPGERDRKMLERREWDFPGFEPLPTPETKRPALSSIYALTKYDQERACLVAGAAYGIPTVALRLFNVYGPGQALSNPYTGVLAIFASRLLNGRAPRVFEDGEQRRDFVSVHDVARAFALALERDGADGRAVNIGSGESITVNALAALLARTLGKEIAPEVTGEFRVGDIRHCFADVSLARETLGFESQVSLDDGIAELAEWLAGQTAVDRVDEATAELAKRGLTG
ncbi:MAG: NAD-dependent epimerase/dehydratase family protein [Gaiellaceae bacterium]